MDKLYYQQKKTDSECKLSLSFTNEGLVYNGTFKLGYTKGSVEYYHNLIVNKVTGDVEVEFKMIHNDGKDKKNHILTEKNNFTLLNELCRRGFYKGEKEDKFWGKKYNNNAQSFFNKIKESLLEYIDNDFLSEKEYKCDLPLFEFLVDYHLFKKEIKSHDNVYNDIISIYPKKKYLKLNDNKFLPSVLDELEIKSKFFIGELSKRNEDFFNIHDLKFLCTLFGENYIDYIKKIPKWKSICDNPFRINPKYTCKDKSEKLVIVKMLSNRKTDVPLNDSHLNSVYILYDTRNFLEGHGYDLKIRGSSRLDLEILKTEWKTIKKQITRGYKLKYKIPEEVIKDIEKPIKVGDEVFLAKVLLSEDDFLLEGMKMKNCLGEQFFNGGIYLYLSFYLVSRKKRIDLQYKNGVLSQSYAKANTPVNNEIFDRALTVLNKRIYKYSTLTWTQEKINLVD